MEPNLAADIARALAYEADADKFGREHFTVWSVEDGPTDQQFEVVVTEQYGEAAQAQRYRVIVEKI